MTFDEYQTEAARTATFSDPDARLACLALGLTGEAGEVADMVKKFIYQGHDLDLAKLHKELGDVLWYLTGLASFMGTTLENVAEANIAKLNKRYPNGFNAADSIARVDESIFEGGR